MAICSFMNFSSHCAIVCHIFCPTLTNHFVSLVFIFTMNLFRNKEMVEVIKQMQACKEFNQKLALTK